MLTVGIAAMLTMFICTMFPLGVLAQVDDAMAAQEYEKITKMKRKQLQSVEDDIRCPRITITIRY